MKLLAIAAGLVCTAAIAIVGRWILLRRKPVSTHWRNETAYDRTGDRRWK